MQNHNQSGKIKENPLTHTYTHIHTYMCWVFLQSLFFFCIFARMNKFVCRQCRIQSCHLRD